MRVELWLLPVILILVPSAARPCMCVPPPLRWLPVEHQKRADVILETPVNAAGVACLVGEFLHGQTGPYNAAAVTIDGPQDAANNPVFTRVSDFVAAIRPSKGWEVGADVRMRFATDEDFVYDVDKPDPRRISLRVGPAIVASQGPVALTVGAPQTGTVSVPGLQGACVRKVEAVSRKLELELSADQARYGAVMLYQTTVDGLPWEPRESHCHSRVSGEGWTRPGTDKLYVQCGGGDKPGLKPGAHLVRMRASIPGVGVIAESDLVVVVIECESSWFEPFGRSVWPWVLLVLGLGVVFWRNRA